MVTDGYWAYQDDHFVSYMSSLFCKPGTNVILYISCNWKIKKIKKLGHKILTFLHFHECIVTI